MREAGWYWVKYLGVIDVGHNIKGDIWELTGIGEYINTYELDWIGPKINEPEGS